MTIHRWLEKPRALAALTLAFALVPVAFAFITFRAARERDAKLFDTAAEVLGAQLNLSTYRHQTFLNIMRNPWRMVTDPAHPPRTALPPAGWPERVPHLRAIGYASHDDEAHLTLRWQEGRAPLQQTGDNLAGNDALAEAMKRARLSNAPVLVGARLPGDVLAVVEAVTDANDNALVRGYLIEWLDLASICRDPSLPLIRGDALIASPIAMSDAREIVIGEGEAQWRAWIARGPGFTREYGTPTPWIGFVALGLSVLPLSVLVMLASRAGKFRAALEAEREVVRLKTHFLHSVSHEFRTPLSVIQSGVELIEHYADQLPPERRAQALRQIKDSTQHMNEMVEQVLTLSRIESHQMPVSVKPVHLHELCAEIINTVRAATQDRCPVELRCDAALTINSDPTLLRSILGNLLSNAVKYSRDGSAVTIEVTPSADAVEIIVRDHGCGIAANDLRHVCEPFQRGANVGDAPGSGLGLAIASKCVALLGGTLHIDSTLGVGTTVTLHLKNPQP